MKFSTLNQYIGRINELVDLAFTNDKTNIPSLWKILFERLKNEINSLYEFVLNLIHEYHKINNECDLMYSEIKAKTSTIKSQKGMLKKQGQEIVEQRKEIERLKKIVEDKSNNNLAPTRRYYVFLTKYNPRTKSYDRFIHIVETHNINEYIGKHYFFGINDIKSISYTSPIIPNQECENAFLYDGYTKLDEFTFIKRGENNEITL